MGSISRRARRMAAAAVVIPLALAGAAVAAHSGAYRGRTSQGQAVTFRISHGAVEKFKLVVNDRCPDGHTLVVTASYPTMTISRGRFGGSFKPVGGRRGERATLQGSVGAHKVTGSISNTTYSARERRLCQGRVRFSARHT